MTSAPYVTPAKYLESVETSEAEFYEMLGAVPPAAQHSNSFAVGEPLSHNAAGSAVFACYRHIGEKYETRNMTLSDFRAVAR